MSQAILLSAANTADIPNWFVVCMGIGTVFVGLICIIILCSVMSLFFRNRKEEPVQKIAAPASTVPVENRREILAAVCAAAAEDMGTDISAIKVISFKKI